MNEGKKPVGKIYILVTFINNNQENFSSMILPAFFGSFGRIIATQ